MVLAAVFEGPGRVVVQDVPPPSCPSGGLLLAVHACAVCGSDVRIAAHGNPHIQPPQILGHEVVGTVAESDTAAVPVGGRVVIAPAIGCGRCRWCRAGRPNRCPDLRTIGYEFAGGFAEQLAVPAAAVAQGSVIPAPDDLPDQVACLTEPLACCLNGQEQVSVGEGDRVVIVGAGPIGVLHARLAAARGASAVVMVEQQAARRAQAERLGLGLVLPADDDLESRLAEATDGGADVVIVAAPAATAQARSLAWLGRGGRLCLFGGLPPEHPPVPLETNRIHYGELLVTGCHGSSPRQNVAAMELLRSGAVPAADLVTAVFELADACLALAAAARGEGLKTVVCVRAG